jgi:branched-chain amino acid transport system substrate-binding protein
MFTLRSRRSSLRSLTLLASAAALALGVAACDKKAPTAPTAPAPRAAAAEVPPTVPKTAAASIEPRIINAAFESAEPTSGDTIVIGHYGSLTGSEATFGQSTSQGIRLAIEEFNAKGGFKGQKIQLKEYDTRGDANEAKLAVERLVKSDKVTCVLGEVASKLSLVGAPICQDGKVPMISPSSTNPNVTAVGDYIFRVCFIDPFQGLAGAKFSREYLKAKSAAVLIDQGSPYAVGLANEFTRNFKSLGGTIVTEQKFTAGAQDFTSQLTSIRSAKPDVVYVPGYYTDVGNIALQARKLGITQPLLGGDGWDSEQLAKIAKDSIEGCYYTNHYAPDQPDARVQEFIKNYRKAYGSTPDGLAALGYDAAKILFDSMARAKSLSGADLRDAIAQTSKFPGVTGEISINKDRDAVKAAVVVEMAVSEGQSLAEPKYVRTVAP